MNEQPESQAERRKVPSTSRFRAVLSKAVPSSLKKRRFWRYLRRIRRKHIVWTGYLTGGLIVLFFVISFFFPSNLIFSLSTSTCTFNPTFLPRLTKHYSSDTYTSVAEPSISVGSYPLFSHKTCVTAHKTPDPTKKESIRLAPFGNPLLRKRITVTSESLPEINAHFDIQKAVGAASSLKFSLSHADGLFAYKINGNGKTATCSVIDITLSCDLAPLALKQATSYPVTIERFFHEQPEGRVFEQTIAILDPVIITKSSIKKGVTVYDSPTSVVITASKNLVSARNVALLKDKSAEHISGTNFTITGKTITVTFDTPLARETEYELKIRQLTADDSSQLAKVYSLPFRTSGGPVVSGVSIGSSRVSPYAEITIGFDVPLKPKQKFSTFASIEIDGQTVSATVSHSGKSLTISPNSSLPRCTSFTVKVAKGLVNKYDIGGGKAWHFTSRTLCQVAFSIGTSVQGRSITAYRFGSGGSKIVFVGGMHGNEQSSVGTMNAWINYLEDHGHQIPKHRSIIVIPNHNPDGFAATRRTNANTVDLNRNFPSNDWRTDIQMPGGQNLPHGGGKKPLDQPESKALADYISRERPRLVLTYHAVARIIISNDVGDSIARAKKYAQDSGYSFVSNANSGGTFEYATTGEFEDWLADKKGIPAILVELGYMYSSEFENHRTAMWNLVQLP